MAIDNLNIMTSWIPAWQQTDKYSSQPWCLRSKNLDIFSSSKSVKWTAWTTPTQSGADVIYDDGVLCLKTDGKVYENDTLLVDPSTWFVAYDVCYDWWRYGTYTPAERWTPTAMSVKYVWDNREAFTIFTETSSYTYNKKPYIVPKTIALEHLKYDWDDPTTFFANGYMLHKIDTSTRNCRIAVTLNTWQMGKFKIAFYAENGSSDTNHIYLYSISKRVPHYYYNAQTDSMTTALKNIGYTYYNDWDIDIYTQPYLFDLDSFPSVSLTYQFDFRLQQPEGDPTPSTWTWNGDLYMNILWWDGNVNNMTVNGTTYYGDYYDYYTYLPNRPRTLKETWEYQRMKGATFQPIYKRNWEWILSKWNYLTRYDYVQDMWWENDSSMDVIDMIVWNENVQMIGNQDWNGYIIPCYLTWWKGTPYIAYWCTFKGAMNIDYLLYLVGEDRGVSQLRVFNGQELAPLIWWNRKDGEDFIDTDEQYKFNGMMVEYKWNLILATEDNRIFEYWQTYGGKGGSFILDVPWTITWIKVQWDDLIVFYSITETVWWVETTYHYTTTYQDAETKKNFLDREAEYPIAIGNHLLEKEESDLFVSYKIPNKSCSLEFRWNANHYTFWTFKVENPWSMDYITNHFKINGTNGDYYLEYVENHWDEYTFKLVGDLPEQTNSTSKTLLYYDEEWELWNTWATYESYHHFRYIGEITADGYKEGEYRFHNLNNLLDLPKSHTLQIKVIGKWNNKGTPELFTVDLVANQRNRW